MPNLLLTQNDLSKDQLSVYNSIIKWVNDKDNKLLTFGGVAGSGKTTLIGLLSKNLNRNIAFACYTGKAANVLRKKLDDNGVRYSYCGTIHGLMYIPIVDKHTLRVSGWKRRPYIEEDLIFIDEASMVGGRIFRDLQSYGKKILAIGDHAQLPPIDKSEINLMEKPDLKLTEIHRQAEGNPIIKLSAMVRHDEDITDFVSDDNRVRFMKKNDDALDEIVIKLFEEKEKRLDSALLCYFNKSRIRYNSIIRDVLGYGIDPEIGDLVICLKNTQVALDKAIFNGMRGFVENCALIGNHKYNADIDFPDENIKINDDLCRYQFGREGTFQTPLELAEYGFKVRTWEKLGLLFDYGYCLSVHKFQGSQANNVILFVERSKFCSDDDFRRWLYTGITRSSENLVVAI